MSESFLRLHFLSLFLLSFVSSSSSFFVKDNIDDLVACRSDKIKTFTQFKNEFDSTGCNQTSDFNKVLCDNTTGEITKLRLRACLSGTLKSNSSLFKLHHLRFLDLSENNFISSSLPSEFGNLNRLEFLSLSSNGFIGQIPSSFNNLSLLNALDLSLNELTGSFPLVSNLTKLSALSLDDNHFSGKLSTNSKNSLFEMRNLRYLNLAFNNFSSNLPYEFGNLNKLELLYLSSNDFLGQVPPAISNLTSLTELFLDNNKLAGSFPVQNLTKLSKLQLYYNRFSGNLPSSLFTMPFLSYLNLCRNNFTGPIELRNSSLSSKLEQLCLGGNHFEGQILETISKFTTLKFLDVSFLNTPYTIDLSLFSSLKSLIYLDVSGNSISSKSWSSDSGISLNLASLKLSGCGITKFPNILKTLEKLEFIDMSNNRIKGKIPEWIWSLSLLGMDITNNNFNGFQGSTEVLANSSMRMLFLDANRLEGPLPNHNFLVAFCSYRIVTNFLWLIFHIATKF